MPFAGSLHIGPTRLKSVANGYANFVLPSRFQWRQVDTPQLPHPISLQRFQNDARRNAVKHSSLNDLERPEMSGQTPNRPRQPGVAVIPTMQSFRTDPNPLILQFRYDLRPQSRKL